MGRVCVDACFLIGLYDERDQHHSTAITQFSEIFGERPTRNILVAPWPILYECFGTRYARDRRKTTLLNQQWSYLRRFDQLDLLDDHPFRSDQLEEFQNESSRSLSLVDRVLRAMILAPKPSFDFFLTYNAGDFADACRASGIPLLDERASLQSYGF